MPGAVTVATPCRATDKQCCYIWDIFYKRWPTMLSSGVAICYVCLRFCMDQDAVFEALQAPCFHAFSQKLGHGSCVVLHVPVAQAARWYIQFAQGARHLLN